MLHHLRPACIAELCCFFGGADDIDKENRGERLFELGVTSGGSAPVRNRSRQRFITMVVPPGDGGFCVVLGTRHRAAANGFVPRWQCPINLSPVADAVDLDGAPLQQDRRADPSNAPCLRRVAGDVRLMDSDAKELWHGRNFGINARPIERPFGPALGLLGPTWAKA